MTNIELIKRMIEIAESNIKRTEALIILVNKMYNKVGKRAKDTNL